MRGTFRIRRSPVARHAIAEGEGIAMGHPILILSALVWELGALVEAMTDLDEVEITGCTFRQGMLGGNETVVASVGIGKVNAAMAATLAIDRFAPRLLLFTGVAGGLDPALRIGDVVVADRVVQHDTGVAGADGFQPYQPGHLPFFDPTDAVGYQPSPRLLEEARIALTGLVLDRVLGRTPKLVFGTVATGDQFIESDAERRRIHETFGAHAVEMEGGAVAQVAAHFGVDHLVIRSLSDLAGSGSEVDFDRFFSEVSINSIKVVRTLLSAFETVR